MRVAIAIPYKLGNIREIFLLYEKNKYLFKVQHGKDRFTDLNIINIKNSYPIN